MTAGPTWHNICTRANLFFSVLMLRNVAIGRLPITTARAYKRKRDCVRSSSNTDASSEGTGVGVLLEGRKFRLRVL
jgi:hypothetical protein